MSIRVHSLVWLLSLTVLGAESAPQPEQQQSKPSENVAESDSASEPESSLDFEQDFDFEDDFGAPLWPVVSVSLARLDNNF